MHLTSSVIKLMLVFVILLSFLFIFLHYSPISNGLLKQNARIFRFNVTQTISDLPKNFSLAKTRLVTAKKTETKFCRAMLSSLLSKPGAAELKQMKTWLNITQNNSFNSSNYYLQTSQDLLFNVSFKIEMNCLVIFIVEYRTSKNVMLPMSIRGGSGFHTITVGNSTIAYCPFNDFANGSYAIYCPLYEQCVQVTTSLLYFDYMTHPTKTDYFPINRILFNSPICLNRTIPFPRSDEVYWTKSVPTYINEKTAVTSSWELVGKNNKRPLTISQLKSCARKLTFPIHFIGDSHSRNMAYHFRHMSGKPTKGIKTHSDVTEENIHVHFTHLIIHTFLPQVRRTLIQIKANQSRSFVILNTGNWDIHFSNFSFFESVTIPTLRQQLFTMKQEHLFDNVSVVFFNVPPLPHWIKMKHITGGNILKIAASNRLLMDVMQGLNFKTVDYFSLARHFINDSARHDFHFLMSNSTGSYGTTGTALANYVLHLICEISGIKGT